MSDDKMVLEPDTSKLNAEFDRAEARRKKLQDDSEKTLDLIDKKSKWTFRRVFGAAKASWYIIDNLMQATGQSISAEFRLMINAALSAVSIMQPIIAAEAVTPGMQVQAMLGAMQIALALANIQRAQGEFENMSNMFDTMHALRGMDTLIGYLEFL